jgi:hypothetical protein
MLTAGASWQITDLAPEKGGETKKQAPSKPAQWKPNSKAGQLWATELISGTWGQHTNVNCHTSLRVTKQLTLKDRGKKTLPYHLVRLWQSFCLNTNTRTDAGGVTPEHKLRLKLYCSWTWRVFCVYVCLFVCLLISPHWFLWGFVLVLFCFLFVWFFLFCFVSFTIVS